MEIKVKVFEDDDLEVPESPEAFMAFWQEKIDAIPEEFRSIAKIELVGDSRWECGYLQLDIYYMRGETPEEFSARKCEELARTERLKTIEIKELDRLKRKYPAA